MFKKKIAFKSRFQRGHLQNVCFISFSFFSFALVLKRWPCDCIFIISLVLNQNVIGLKVLYWPARHYAAFPSTAKFMILSIKVKSFRSWGSRAVLGQTPNPKSFTFVSSVHKILPLKFWGSLRYLLVNVMNWFFSPTGYLYPTLNSTGDKKYWNVTKKQKRKKSVRRQMDFHTTKYFSISFKNH